MRNLLFVFSTCLLFTLNLQAQVIAESSFATLPELAKKSNLIVLDDQMHVDIRSSSKMTVSREIQMLILNKKAKAYASLYLPYDKHTSIKKKSITVYDKDWNVVDKIKGSEYQDVSSVGTSNLYSDDRLVYFEYVPKTYPFIIEIEYEYETSNTAFIPDWDPVPGFYASILKSHFEISVPQELKLSHKDINHQNFKVSKSQENASIKYSVQNLKAVTNEDLSPPLDELTLRTTFALNKFNLAGKSGSAENWEEFGLWCHHNLLTGIRDLPQSTKREVDALIREIDDPYEKARKVYEYMQSKTHYVSVQIGIGGWKPTPAMEVDRLGYGDCKGLTNYTKAMLDYIGIPSEYALIYAGRDSKRNIESDIASQQGNHVILMLPFEKDTVWLECTNQKIPFGYLGRFTDDRDALAISETGGRIVHTKSYSTKENLQSLSGKVDIEANGSLNVELNLKSEGARFDDNYPVVYLDSKEKEAHYKDLFSEVNNIHLNTIEVRFDKEEIVLHEKLAFQAENYAVINGDDMMVRLNMFNTQNDIPKRSRSRQNPLFLDSGFTDRDVVVINIPEGYRINYLPQEISVNNDFGRYEMRVSPVSESQIRFQRELIIEANTFPSEQYDSYRKFRKFINQKDQIKIILTKIDKT